VRLLAAAEALRDAIDWPLLPIGQPAQVTDRIALVPSLAAIRARLDGAAWDVAWEEGRAMTLEQAIACALDESCRCAGRYARSRRMKGASGHGYLSARKGWDRSLGQHRRAGKGRLSWGQTVITAVPPEEAVLAAWPIRAGFSSLNATHALPACILSRHADPATAAAKSVTGDA